MFGSFNCKFWALTHPKDANNISLGLTELRGLKYSIILEHTFKSHGSEECNLENCLKYLKS